jgi:hypothetical protein
MPNMTEIVNLFEKENESFKRNHTICDKNFEMLYLFQVYLGGFRNEDWFCNVVTIIIRKLLRSHFIPYDSHILGRALVKNVWGLLEYLRNICTLIIWKKGVANMASYAISSSLILVIHDNMIIGTNLIVLACLCRHF